MTEPKSNIHPMKDLENKLLFSDPKNKRALISLIKATLEIDVEDVAVMDGKTIRSRKKESEKDGENTVLYVREVDVLAALPNGTKVIIEFQMGYQKTYGKRAVLYLNNRFSQQLELLAAQEGSDYSDVHPVYIVSFLNHVYFDDFEGFVSTFGIMEKKRGVPLLDEFGNEMEAFVFIELPKYNSEDEEVSQLLKEWCQHFTGRPLSEETDEDVLYAHNILESYKHDKEVQTMIEMYKLREIATRDEGKEEGITIGLDRGRVEGKAEGQVEGQEKVAINMLRSGMPIEQIEKLTELNLVILQQLAREQKESSLDDEK